MPRSLVRARLGTVAALVVTALASVPTAPALADTAGLRMEADITYTPLPSEGVVRVRSEISVRNTMPNRVTTTTTSRSFFDAIAVPLPLEATNVVATSGGRNLRVDVEEVDEGELLVATIRLRSRLFFDNSQQVLLTFDIKGDPPRSFDPVRINPAYMWFYAWAWGDMDRTSITVVSPPGFDMTVEGSPMQRVELEDGSAAWRAEAIAEPLEFLVVVTGTRDEALERTTVRYNGRPIVVRSWPGDMEWREVVSTTLERGLPLLEELVGLPWPLDRPLVVTEAVAPNEFGYAGWYVIGEDAIEIGEELDEHIILHEALHAWLNQQLFDARWIDEGLANELGAIVARTEFDQRLFPTAVRTTASGAVALNAWADVVVADEQSDEGEEYGYNTSWWITRRLIGEVGIEGMQLVFQAAAADHIAYQGEVPPETVDPRDDWRRYLDLLEELAGSTEATELFEEYVITMFERDAFEARSESRASYADLARSGGDWMPPLAVRMPMSDWDFALASERIDRAAEVIALRDDLLATADELGLELPETMEAAYESADGGFSQALAVGARYGAAMSVLEEAGEALRADRDFYTRMGLRGADPEAMLGAARTDFRADDTDRAIERGEALIALLEAAPDRGRNLVFTWAAWAAGLLLLVALAAWWTIRRRRKPQLDALEPDTLAPEH